MRKITKIMKGWSFTGKDGNRTPVDLPHTWNGKDGQDGGNDYYRGTCIYDCVVKKPEYEAEERVYLQFHGVNASIFYRMKIVWLWKWTTVSMIAYILRRQILLFMEEFIAMWSSW